MSCHPSIFFLLGWKETLHLHKEKQRGRAWESISEKSTDSRRWDTWRGECPVTSHVIKHGRCVMISKGSCPRICEGCPERTQPWGMKNRGPHGCGFSGQPLCIHSCPLIRGGHVPRPQWLPETTDSTQPSSYYVVFLYIHACDEV